MSASSPTTRIVPLATAVVYGDSCGWNARTYGIERRVGDAERQLRVHLGRERNPAGRPRPRDEATPPPASASSARC